MSHITEDELKHAFRDDINTYPFKTTLRFEVPCEVGKIDIELPDYDVVVEAKSDGDIKRAVGQAICYSEATGAKGYILVPHTEITNTILQACKRAEVGVLTTTITSSNFKIAHDVGGFETFHPGRYENVQFAEDRTYEARSEIVVGGVD